MHLKGDFTYIRDKGARILEFVDKQEYLVLAEKSETKLEYENGEVLDMAGSTAEHNRICLNIANVFDEKLPKGCQSFGINVRVEATENNSYYYPDVLAVCGEIEYSPDSPISILNPSIIVEVLSAGHTYNNMQKKLDVYKGLDSVKDVLYVESDRYLVRVFSRVTANWEYFAYISEDTEIPLSGTGISINMAAIYKRLIYNPETKSLQFCQP